MDRTKFEAEIADPESLRFQVFEGFKKLIRVRKSSKAFHPQGGQIIANIHESVLVLLRTSPDEENTIICLHNVSPERQEIIVDLNIFDLSNTSSLTDILSQRIFLVSEQKVKIDLGQFEILWLSC